MKDRNYLIHEVETIVGQIIEDQDVLDDIVDKVAEVLQGYDVIERCTDIIPASDEDEKILQRYAACLYVEGKSRKTIDQYLYRLRDFRKHSITTLKQVGVYDIRMYLGLLKQRGNVNSTLEGVRNYLCSFYKWMVLEGLIDKNPTDLLKPIKFKSKKVDPFSELDMERIRNGCENLRERALVEILVSSGVRVSELTALDLSDIDFETKSVHVRCGKGDKERTTYLSDIAVYYLTKYLELRKDNDPALFISKLGRLQPGGVRLILKNIEERCGVDDIHPHRFRHTFATVLSKNGMPVLHIQQLLGHVNTDTTLIYIELDSNMIQYEHNQYMRI